MNESAPAPDYTVEKQLARTEGGNEILKALNDTASAAAVDDMIRQLNI